MMAGRGASAIMAHVSLPPLCREGYPVAMPAQRTEWTVDMLDALPDDGQRYELIDGELFATPAPSDVHQLVIVELLARLHAYLRSSAVGRLLVSPADVRRGDPARNRVQPDV